jgi:cytochrome c oxidase subunit 2
LISLPAVFAAVLQGFGAHQSALHRAGPQAGRLEHLWWFLFWVAAIVYLLVIGALGLGLFHRRRRDDPANSDPQRVRRTAVTVTAATGGTVMVLFTFLAVSYSTGRPLTRPPLAHVSIELTGHQWWWQAVYEDTIPANRVTTANEIHVPVGRPVLFKMTSTDVIHSVWVPSLNGKRDLIPGYTSTMWFQADTAGVYRGQCAEFCGMQHAKMALLIIAEPEDVYQSWLRGQRLPASTPGDSVSGRGQSVFTTGSCVLCHTIRGTTAGSNVGPDLTHLASRHTLAAASIPNRRGYLAGWVLDPQSIKPGVHMPPNGLSSRDLQALLVYLEGLR